ncbi:SET1 [Candida metapsilosis]|uniref:Histone-lysine N-methyltransferase, H3 lysine-4 specific n=1 Tax=Candida metapsilosis TaxID=273372 RepID=A0A8H8D8J4_9ASCO|nr:SET1 [Candida metapsilosis]
MLSRTIIKPTVFARSFTSTAIVRNSELAKPTDSAGKEIVSGAPRDLVTSRVVRIYQEAKPATQSGHHNGHNWKLDWDVLGKGNRWENDLIGYQSSSDYMQGTIMKFDTKETAIRFAENQGWDHYVQEPKKLHFRKKEYRDTNSTVDEGQRQSRPDEGNYNHQRGSGKYSNISRDRQSQWESSENSGINTPTSVSNGGSQTVAYSSTDVRTGINQKDSEYSKLAHHRESTRPLELTKKTEGAKNYKVMYDPELDPNLPKTKIKTKSRKVRFNGEGVDSPKDPRLSNLSSYLQKPNKKSSKFPFKQLPQAKFIYDQDSLGEAPRTTLVIWDLPISANETYLRNYLASFDLKIENLKTFDDPKFGVPLGIATFKCEGSMDKASSLAEKFIQTVKRDSVKIDGTSLKIALNDNDDNLLNSKINIAKGKLTQQQKKREEEEEKRRLLKLEEQKKIEEQKKAEELKRQEEEKKKEEAERLQRKELGIVSASEGVASKYKPDTTVLSTRHGSKVVPGTFLPNDLAKYVKNRPYLLIRDKYVSTKHTSSQDIKRALKKYDWTRVLSDKTGFYVVFNSLKECERCFHNEDCRRFYEYKLVMEMAIPENYHENDKDNDLSNSVLNEAANILTKEFETFLVKDIRERIIAPHILSLLDHDRYPTLVEELKAKEKELASKSKSTVSNMDLKQNAMSILEKQKRDLQEKIPYFKKAEERFKSSRRDNRRPIIPMSHALNLDEDEENDNDDIFESVSGSMTPLAEPLKRVRSSTATSVVDESELDEPATKKHKSKLQESYDLVSSGDESMDDVEEVDVDEGEDVEPELPVAAVDSKYAPTEGKPMTVYPESSISTVVNLKALQENILDTEDLELANSILEDIKESSDIPNMDYWAWKQNESGSTSLEVAEYEDAMEELPSRLDSTTGSFKSDGFKKIPEIDKVEYLPHRKKANKPIKTVQYEEDDDEKPAENSNVLQSSRVNRANNRRFAADITAQIGSESDVMSLNALTKRKKPVTFARSTIHNWGLYAMEPIAAKEMIIEYVGERIRQQVAEHREKSYLRTGIGSSYLFRIDENTVIDATKKGGIARFINHCCNPSCTAKIIKVEGKKRIVIYALRDIEANEELTYDYKFERETNDEERIRCLCGAPGCKGYLN